MQRESHLSQGDSSLPSGPNFLSSALPGPSQSHRVSWQSQHIPSIRSGRLHHGPPEEAQESLTRGRAQASSSASTKTAKWWRIRLFRGMINDIKRRAPYYWNDWTDAWDYRIVPATIYMYFAKYVGAWLYVALILLTYLVVSCLLWLSLWICLRKRIKVTGSTRSFWLLSLGQWYSPFSLPSH